MDKTSTILLAILAVITAAGFLGLSFQSWAQHRRLTRLLSDLATMIGDAIDAILEGDE